jgi:hypothetical protein
MRDKALEKKLPSGYYWRSNSYADDEGIVISITLVSSSYKPGTFRDKVFGRPVLTSAYELAPEAEQTEIDATVRRLKNGIASHYFNW